jgi:hypothetical protein
LCENNDEPALGCSGVCFLSKMLAQDTDQPNPFESGLTTDGFEIILGFFHNNIAFGGAYFFTEDKEPIELQSFYRLLLEKELSPPP